MEMTTTSAPMIARGIARCGSFTSSPAVGVKARVQDAAVVRTLMPADAGLFFQHRDLPVGRPRQPLAGDGQSDDAAANDDRPPAHGVRPG